MLHEVTTSNLAILHAIWLAKKKCEGAPHNTSAMLGQLPAGMLRAHILARSRATAATLVRRPATAALTTAAHTAFSRSGGGRSGDVAVPVGQPNLGVHVANPGPLPTHAQAVVIGGGVIGCSILCVGPFPSHCRWCPLVRLACLLACPLHLGCALGPRTARRGRVVALRLGVRWPAVACRTARQGCNCTAG